MSEGSKFITRKGGGMLVKLPYLPSAKTLCEPAQDYQPHPSDRAPPPTVVSASGLPAEWAAEGIMVGLALDQSEPICTASARLSPRGPVSTPLLPLR